MHIEQLIEQYFAGETSVKEERQIREYFQRSDIPAHLQQYQSLFQWQQSEREVATPEFDFSFMEQFDNQKVSRIIPIRKTRIFWLKIAAMLVIGLGIWWTFPQDSTQTMTQQPQAINWEIYEVEDPEKALEETKAALKLLSEKLGKR
ncbi:MAG: hypothetical protein AB8G22_07795 [Saprospiraceae bacterium]